MDVLRAIGNTSLVRLHKVVPPHCAKILVKLEWENPTGSLEDRMAQAVVSRAEADGLKPGGSVVEYTGGSTGTSLALDVSRQPGTYWTNQLENHDSIAGYHGLGEEISTQTEGKVDAFVHGVGTDEAKDMARRLAREEALFAGTSSGANVVAALRLGERLGPAATVVTLMCDSGLEYLSTDVHGHR
jgi:cysteine synthase